MRRKETRFQNAKIGEIGFSRPEQKTRTTYSHRADHFVPCASSAVSRSSHYCKCVPGLLRLILEALSMWWRAHNSNTPSCWLYTLDWVKTEGTGGPLFVIAVTERRIWGQGREGEEETRGTWQIRVGINLWVHPLLTSNHPVSYSIIMKTLSPCRDFGKGTFVPFLGGIGRSRSSTTSVPNSAWYSLYVHLEIVYTLRVWNNI